MSGEERTTLAMILAIVLTLGGVYFGLRPLVADYQAAQVAVGARGLEIEALNERKIKLVQLEGQFNKFETQIQQLELAVPSEPQYPEILEQLTALANEAQLTLTSIQPQQSDLVNTTSVPINLTVRGAFPGMLAFAQKIETNLRPITVTSVSLIDSGDQNTANQLTATIQMRFVRTAGVSGGGSR